MVSYTKVYYVSDINKIVSESKIKEFIKKNDIIMDEQIYSCAKTIKEENKKIILLGGPSSSGKTTTTRKLSLYLSSLGLNPIPISLDNYFVNKVNMPKLEDGSYNYECLEAIDLELFNEQISSLLNGEAVNLSIYDFVTGTKSMQRESITLKKKIFY